MKFIRKVYAILACQLTLTFGFIVLVQTSYQARMFTINNRALAIACAIGAVISSIGIICCCGRTVPTNYIMLFIFTICETYMVGGLTAVYERDTVILAGLATALVTIALTIYAMRTKVKMEVFGAMAFVIYLAMFPLMIIGFFIRAKVLTIVYSCLGLVLYSLFLIIDTMMIVGGKAMTGQQCDLDEYVIGAMMLYIDIIMIFVYLLKILGSAKD